MLSPVSYDLGSYGYRVPGTGYRIGYRVPDKRKRKERHAYAGVPLFSLI
jgi:hypothetical protein